MKRKSTASKTAASSAKTHSLFRGQLLKLCFSLSFIYFCRTLLCKIFCMSLNVAHEDAYAWWWWKKSRSLHWSINDHARILMAASEQGRNCWYDKKRNFLFRAKEIARNFSERRKEEIEMKIMLRLTSCCYSVLLNFFLRHTICCSCAISRIVYNKKHYRNDCYTVHLSFLPFSRGWANFCYNKISILKGTAWWLRNENSRVIILADFRVFIVLVYSWKNY